MSDYAVEIKGLKKSFDNFTLGPIDLNIPRGTIVGYIGQNGAGKSTTIKLLLGLLRPDFGEINILGKRDAQNVMLKDRIGVVFDDLYIPQEMNLMQVEKFCSMVYSKWDEKRFYELKNVFKLSNENCIKNDSRWMKLKVGAAIALSHHAELLILDEATSGLDPIIRDEILDILLDFMQDENHTILISSHILSDLEKVSDYIAFINDGKLLFFEGKDELKEKYAICSISNEEAEKIDSSAIVGRRVHNFGQDLLVKRDEVHEDFELQKPSIEDIMIYFVKGDKNESSNL